MKDQFVWMDIPLSDLDRAIAFYSAVLGEKVKKESTQDFVFGLFPHADTDLAGCFCEMRPSDNQPFLAGQLIYLRGEL